ncbi:MAG: phosphoenolpyruvate--protein phosphotransferase, partial [Actinomycetota bacterium]|nr:phosphoenolpyruvate--protein phosphotransferase [Actinomycetota bacterium]
DAARDDAVPESERSAELQRFAAATEAVAGRLQTRTAQASGAAAEVLSATATLARDRGLRSLVQQQTDAGASAEVATVRAIEQLEAMFRSAGGLMAERVTDLRDIRSRVVAELTGQPEPGVPTPDEPCVLLSDDLAPSDTAGLDPRRILAIATTLGGPTSHTAIIARQLSIPCVVAVAGLDDVPEGVTVLVDGSTGEVEVSPDAIEAAARAEAAEAEHARSASWTGPGRTRDGHPVAVMANVQDGAGARAAAQAPVEGVGLFRTELCFLGRATEPSVEEQAQVYGEVFEAFAGRKVVVRTLDAGSDKPLEFASTPDEPNPALGVRGLRVGMDNPEMLERQLEAIAVAARRASADVWVMAPMVATVAEARWFAERVWRHGLTAGAMVEVPSAALHADRLLRHLDFLSIGTNDLSQYAMAADRMASRLSALTDPWQPALLWLVQRVGTAGQAAGKPVGLCGEAAADPLLACVLVGLGVTSLSAAGPAAARVGSQLSRVDLQTCRSAADAALTCDGPEEARAAARTVLTDGQGG